MLLLLLCCLAVPALARSAEEVVRLQVVEPFLDLHTGPGGGFPVDRIAKRGQWIAVIGQRADWYQIRLDDGHEGWVPSEMLAKTVDASGNPAQLPTLSLADRQRSTWELSVMAGDFDGTNVQTVAVSANLSNNLAAELSLSRILGTFSSSDLWGVSLLHHPFPEWRYSPYFSLGAGIVQISPATALVQPADREETFARAGLGLKIWLTRHFQVRVEANQYVIITDRDENEEPEEWKLGFSLFF